MNKRKKQPAKKRPHEVNAYDSKGQIVPTKATVAVPRPKKRTSGVEVVTIEGHADRVDVDADEPMIGFYQYKNANPESFYPATLTLHIPKRRSSK